MAIASSGESAADAAADPADARPWGARDGELALAEALGAEPRSLRARLN